MLARPLVQESHAFASQIAFGTVGDPFERQVVSQGDEAQVCERILDFSTVEELDAGVHDIRHPGVVESFFQRARHEMRPVQHRHVAVFHATLMRGGDGIDDVLRLVDGVLGMVPCDGCPVGQRGFETLVDALLVGGDEAVCHGYDLWGGPVVAVHHDGARAGKHLGEIQDALHVGTAP